MQDSASDSVKKYTLKLNKDGKDYDEQIDINTENETETFHVPKTSSDDEEGDIVYDFKKVSHFLLCMRYIELHFFFPVASFINDLLRHRRDLIILRQL